MLRQSTRKSLAVGVLAASICFVAGCDSSTSPAPKVAASPASPALGEGGRDDAVVVVGTGDATVDVPAVQAAVDHGGVVILEGHFSFDTPPSSGNTTPSALAGLRIPSHAQVKITKAVSILGGENGDGPLATIDGGTIPFYVNAPGQSVTIRRLRFMSPTSQAVLVFAVRDLDISFITVKGLKTFGSAFNSGIGIVTTGIPTPTKPGNPSNVTGALVIAHNDLDLAGGTAKENVLGVTVFSVGDSATPVEVRIVHNRITNTTEPAINFRRVVGRVFIEHNVIATGSIGVDTARGQVIRVANLGTYRIAHNHIRCDWASVSDAQGIGVFSQIQSWPIEHAVVEDNEITMAPSEGTVLTDFSAGIGVYGFANDNLVRHNRIRGHARSGIAMPTFPLTGTPATPQNNAFIGNRFDQFTPSLADYFVGKKALDTQIVGAATIYDERTGTITVQQPGNRVGSAHHDR